MLIVCIILSFSQHPPYEARPAVFCRSCAFYDNVMTNSFT